MFAIVMVLAGAIMTDVQATYADDWYLDNWDSIFLDAYVSIN